MIEPQSEASKCALAEADSARFPFDALQGAFDLGFAVAVAAISA